MSLKRLSNARNAEYFDPSWPGWVERDCVLKGDSQQAAYVLVNGHTDVSHEIERNRSSPICLPAQMTCPGSRWVEFGVNTCAAVKYPWVRLLHLPLTLTQASQSR